MSSPTRPPFEYGATYGYLPENSGAANAHPHVPVTSPRIGPQSPPVTGKRIGVVSQPGKHPAIVTSSTVDQFLRPHQPPGSVKPVTQCVLQLPPEAGYQQWGYVLDVHQILGHVALPLRLVSLMPAPVALTNVTLVRVRFDYTGLRPQWSSHSVVYQLFGPAVASLQDRFARERVFPLEEGSVYCLPSEVFSRGKLSLPPVTTGSLTLLLTVLNPVTLRRLLHKIGGPVQGYLRKLHTTLFSLRALESDPQLETRVSVAMPSGFDLLILNVEHTVETKVIASRQLVQWSEYPAVVLLQDTGVSPPPFCVSLSVLPYFHGGLFFFRWCYHPNSPGFLATHRGLRAPSRRQGHSVRACLQGHTSTCCHCVYVRQRHG